MHVRILAVLVVFLAAARGAGAQPAWTHGQSEHFEVYTTDGARTARNALTYFERVHAFYADILGHNPKLRSRTRLIVFANERQFEPYRPHEQTAAYYLSSADRDYIVMGELDDTSIPVVTHEYSHLVLRHSGGTYPVWLNEGLAEVYSTMRPSNGRVRFGEPLVEHLAYLNSGVTMFDLPRLFAIVHDSPEYAGGDHTGVLYAQSWALAHMLQFDERYGSKWPAFLSLVASGTASADALKQVYGESPEQVGRELRAYVRRQSFMAKQTIDKYQVAEAEKYQTRQAEAFEGALVTANLLAASPRGGDAAREAFIALEAQKPTDLAMLESRAYFEMRRGTASAAASYFERAVAQGSQNVRLLLDYAQLDRSKAAMLLPKALALAPQDADVKIDNAEMLLADRKAADALRLLRDLKQISREQAFMTLQIAANAYMMLNQVEDARAAATRAAQYADADVHVTFAKQLLSAIDDYASRRARAAELAKAAAAAAAAAPAPIREEAWRVEEPRTSSFTPKSFGPANEEIQTVDGRLTEIVCLPGDAGLVMHLAAGNTTRKLLIADPSRIIVRGHPSGTIDLFCGKQDQLLKIGFAPGVNATHGTDGEVRVLDYSR